MLLIIGGGTLHTSSTVLTFFPIKLINEQEFDGVCDHQAEGSFAFYTLPEDLGFPRSPQGAILHFATAKGPRLGLTEPVMLTQHEPAIALDPVAPAN